MIEIVDPHPASEEALARAESELGFPLPREYRNWLSATGAGQPTEDLEIRNGVVTEFYEVEPRGVTYSLTSVRRDRTADSFDAWVPEDYLVVSPEGGGIVAVKVTGDDVGSVWWADYDQAQEIAPRDEHEGDPLPQIMHRLADTWSDFIMLFPEGEQGDLS